MEPEPLRSQSSTHNLMTKIKTLLFGILALLAVSIGVNGQGLEIYDGWLQGNLNAYDFSITNLASLSFAPGASNGVPLSQLSSGGATNTQVLTYNGTMWAPSNAPTGSSGSGSGFPLTSNGNLAGFGLTNGFFSGNGGGLTNLGAVTNTQNNVTLGGTFNGIFTGTNQGSFNLSIMNAISVQATMNSFWAGNSNFYSNSFLVTSNSGIPVYLGQTNGISAGQQQSITQDPIDTTKLVIVGNGPIIRINTTSITGSNVTYYTTNNLQEASGLNNGPIASGKFFGTNLYVLYCAGVTSDSSGNGTTLMCASNMLIVLNATTLASVSYIQLDYPTFVSNGITVNCSNAYNAMTYNPDTGLAYFGIQNNLGNGSATNSSIFYPGCAPFYDSIAVYNTVPSRTNTAGQPVWPFVGMFEANVLPANRVALQNVFALAFNTNDDFIYEMAYDILNNNFSTIFRVSLDGNKVPIFVNAENQTQDATFTTNGPFLLTGTANKLTNSTVTYDVSGSNMVFSIARGIINFTGGNGPFSSMWQRVAQHSGGFGIGAGASFTTGQDDWFFGDNAGASTTTGSDDTFNGHNSGFNNTTGSDNTYYGSGSGQLCVTGNGNAGFGNNASQNHTGTDSFNSDFNNPGIAGENYVAKFGPTTTTNTWLYGQIDASNTVNGAHVQFTTNAHVLAVDENGDTNKTGTNGVFGSFQTNGNNVYASNGSFTISRNLTANTAIISSLLQSATFSTITGSQTISNSGFNGSFAGSGAGLTNIPLPALQSGGASVGQEMAWNGTSWTPFTDTGATINSTVLQTNWILNTGATVQLYTNLSGAVELVQDWYQVTTVAGTGNAGVSLMVSNVGYSAFSNAAPPGIGLTALSIAMPYTNFIGAPVQTNAVFYFTNFTTGSSSASLVTGVGYLTILGNAAASGYASIAGNNTFSGSNVFNGGVGGNGAGLTNLPASTNLLGYTNIWTKTNTDYFPRIQTNSVGPTIVTNAGLVGAGSSALINAGASDSDQIITLTGGAGGLVATSAMATVTFAVARQTTNFTVTLTPASLNAEVIYFGKDVYTVPSSTGYAIWVASSSGATSAAVYSVHCGFSGP